MADGVAKQQRPVVMGPGLRRGDDCYTTTLSRFAARVMPVYSHLARLS